MTTFRGFIAVEISPPPKLIEFMQAVKHSGAPVKLVEPHNIHITLKFLGDAEEPLIDDIDYVIRQATASEHPFPIRLQGTGVFPNKNYIKVVWIGIEQGDPIARIAKTIDQHLVNLGFPTEKRPFSPHLTICRVKHGKNKDELLQAVEAYSTVLFSELMVSNICLKKSELTTQGPIYTTLKTVSLS
ncbi:MAG: RNA 2',3'-cyclic phosphodiesterase [Candidatus Thermoplasmatota archaeon]|nr:RNA 2',3'-cyclic phosphodiesterase [Candidatus Thermoplasmatota archaeon]